MDRSPTLRPLHQRHRYTHRRHADDFGAPGLDIQLIRGLRLVTSLALRSYGQIACHRRRALSAIRCSAQACPRTMVKGFAVVLDRRVLGGLQRTLYSRADYVVAQKALQGSLGSPHSQNRLTSSHSSRNEILVTPVFDPVKRRAWGVYRKAFRYKA